MTLGLKMLHSVSQKEIINRLHFDNPWWKSFDIEERYKDYPRRFYFESFYQLAKEASVNRAVVLMGPRRVGKTVMVYHSISKLLDEGFTSKNILYISLETPIYTHLVFH